MSFFHPAPDASAAALMSTGTFHQLVEAGLSPGVAMGVLLEVELDPDASWDG